jgi:acyl-CoA synthetase (AMP-forming)/AMP-acid ligase II
VVASSCNAPGQLTERGAWQPLADAAGLLATGDMGFADARGHLYVRGRKSAFLKVNGYRINPYELEEALRTLPGVQEAVVVGPPHPVSGQRIVACLEQGPGPRISEPPALLASCRELLAPYKHPHIFLVFDALPRTPAGKPDRTRILEEASRHA